MSSVNCNRKFFSSYGIPHTFLGLIFALQRKPIHDFKIKCRQVPRSSVGRASDRTMLRSVVRVQSLTRGILSFFFFYFCFVCFLFFSSYFFSRLITNLFKSYILIRISSNRLRAFAQDRKFKWCISTKITYVITERRESSIERANPSGKSLSSLLS